MTDRLQEFVGASLADMDRRGLRRAIRVLEGAADSSVMIGGRRCVQLASNNYLGLTTHPTVRAAAIAALEGLGSGAGAVRPIAGTMAIHQECEAKLADLKGTDAAVLMQSGFTANVGVVTALMEPGDVIISDELNHASIIDGIRLSGAEKRIYPHGDLNALEDFLRESSRFKKCLVVTDGVFSMDGDIAPLPDIVALKERYGAALMVDDAHATGVLGKTGGGSIEHFGLHGRVEIQIGTLSKALGAVGGFIAASARIVELITQRSRPFLFSSALPPSVAAGVSAAVDVIRAEPWRLWQLWENTRSFKDGLKHLGFDTGASQTPITPVIVGDSRLAAEMSGRLEEEGVFATSIVYPMVAETRARIRTIVMATHSSHELGRALAGFETAGRAVGVLS